MATAKTAARGRKTKTPEAGQSKTAEKVSVGQESPGDERKFVEYPGVLGTMKSEQGDFYRVRGWAPTEKESLREAGGLKGTLEINNPDTGQRQKYPMELRAREHQGQHYFSAKVDRGPEQNPILVRLVGVDGPNGRFGAVRLAEMEQQGDRTQFQDVRGQGGILRMNEAMTQKILDKEGNLYEPERIQEVLGVSAAALAPSQHREAILEMLERQEVLEQQVDKHPDIATEPDCGQETDRSIPETEPEVEEEEDLGLGR